MPSLSRQDLSHSKNLIRANKSPSKIAQKISNKSNISLVTKNKSNLKFPISH